jgi:hypothetical protein
MRTEEISGKARRDAESGRAKPKAEHHAATKRKLSQQRGEHG